MVQSGEGATGPEADASRIAWAFSGGLIGAEDRRLLVADAPVPRRDEGALPHAGLGFARGFFVGIVVMGDARIGQRPSVPHHPFLDVLAVDLAMRHLPAAPLGLADVAGPALVVGVVDEFVARGDAAGPAFARGVEAKLVHRRRIDPGETDLGGADLDLIAFADFGNTGDVGGAGLPVSGKIAIRNFINIQRGRVQWEVVATGGRIVVRISSMHQRLSGPPLST